VLGDEYDFQVLQHREYVVITLPVGAVTLCDGGSALGRYWRRLGRLRSAHMVWCCCSRSKCHSVLSSGTATCGVLYVFVTVPCFVWLCLLSTTTSTVEDAVLHKV